MAEIFNVQEAKIHLSRLLERVKAGEEIIITKSGKPYARLVPLERKARTLGFVKGSVPDAFFVPLPDDELESWE